MPGNGLRQELALPGRDFPITTGQFRHFFLHGTEGVGANFPTGRSPHGPVRLVFLFRKKGEQFRHQVDAELLRERAVANHALVAPNLERIKITGEHVAEAERLDLAQVHEHGTVREPVLALDRVGVLTVEYLDEKAVLARVVEEVLFLLGGEHEEHLALAFRELHEVGELHAGDLRVGVTFSGRKVTPYEPLLTKIVQKERQLYLLQRGRNPSTRKLNGMLGYWTNWVLRKRAFFYPKERAAYAAERSRRVYRPMAL